MSGKRARKGKPARCRREEKTLLQRLSEALSEEEKDRALASALLALDEEGLERVAERLGADGGATLRALMKKRGGPDGHGPATVSAAKLEQEWHRAWVAWWACIRETGHEDGRYVLQEYDWDPPTFGQETLIEDLEEIAERIGGLVESMRAAGGARGFSMAEAFAESAREAGAGLPEWMAPADPGIPFGPKATRCLLDWESCTAVEEGVGAYEFVRSLRGLEQVDSQVGLDIATVREFILECFDAEDLGAVFAGMERDRETELWRKALDSAHSDWASLHLELGRRFAPTRHLELCRERFAQDWRLALPVVAERVRRKAWADACDLAARAVSTALWLGSQNRWDPCTSLLAERALRHGRRGLDPDLERLLRKWRKAAEALGQEATWRALDTQMLIASKSDDWDAAVEAIRGLPSARLGSLAEDLLVAWKAWVVGGFEDAGGGSHGLPCSAWIRALLEAVTGPADPVVSFRRFVDRWLREMAKSRDALRESASALAALTLDLDRKGELGRNYPIFGALLANRRAWAGYLDRQRHEWLGRCEATGLVACLLAFWKRNLERLALDPGSDDYEECADWLAAVLELRPTAGREILATWSTSHRRRRNLWAALAVRGIDRIDPKATP